MAHGLELRAASAIRVVYILCLAAGTYSHASILVRHGWRWNYGNMPLPTVLFWSSLTLLDPLAALLLFLKPHLGLVFLTLLMLADVVHNTWIIHTYGGILWMVVDQWLFLLFVLATAPRLWRATPR